MKKTILFIGLLIAAIALSGCTEPSNGNGNQQPPSGNGPVQSCTENWSCASWTDCVDGTQTRTCTDTSNCGTTVEKPSETQSCTTECAEDWSCTEWSSCIDGKQTRDCSDDNDCGTTTNKPSTSQTCSQNGGECGTLNEECCEGEKNPETLTEFHKQLYSKGERQNLSCSAELLCYKKSSRETICLNKGPETCGELNQECCEPIIEKITYEKIDGGEDTTFVYSGDLRHCKQEYDCEYNKEEVAYKCVGTAIGPDSGDLTCEEIGGTICPIGKKCYFEPTQTADSDECCYWDFDPSRSICIESTCDTEESKATADNDIETDSKWAEFTDIAFLKKWIDEYTRVSNVSFIYCGQKEGKTYTLIVNIKANTIDGKCTNISRTFTSEGACS